MNSISQTSFIKRQGLKENQKVLVGYSAGPDSTYLALLLTKFRLQPILIYINYHDSDTVFEEERIAFRFAKRYQLELVKYDVSVKPSTNFEAEARRIRFQLYEEVGTNYGTNILFLGHHKNDLVETYLLQKERGSLVQYYGIREHNRLGKLEVLRPLLCLTKSEIYRYLKTNNIEYYEDPTNTDKERRRNAIRPTLNDEDLDHYIALIKKENERLETLYQRLDPLFKGNSVLISDYHQLEEEARRRLLFGLLSRVLLKEDGQSLKGLMSKIMMRLKGNKSFVEIINKNKSFYCSKSCFFVETSLKIHSYCYTVFDGSILDDEEVFFDSALIKDAISFPLTIVPLKEGGEIKTKLRQKNVREFVKKMGVPSYLIDIYPVLKNQKGDIIYIPYYSDLTKSAGPLKLKTIEFLTLRERRGGRSSL